MISKIALLGPICLLVSCLGTPVSASAADMAKLLQDLRSNDPQKVELAIETITDLGPSAAKAVPELTKLLTSGDANTRAHAAHALGKIGKAALPAAGALAKLITDEKPAVRYAALDALGEIEPGPEMVVPLMIASLGDQNPAVIREALHALADRGPSIVPAMIEALKDDRTEYWALLVLQTIGPDAKEAVPAIIEVLKEPDEPWQRMEAAITLGKIGPASASAVPQLVELLDDPEKGVTHAAVYALAMIGPAAKPAAKQIRTHLDTEDPFQWVAGSWALAKIYPDNKTIQKTTARFLAVMLTDEDQQVRRAAAQALLNIKPGPAIMLPALENALKDADLSIVEDALTAIAGLGQDALPVLIHALQHDRVRMQAAYLLQQLGPKAAPAVAALIEAYGNEQRADVRRELLFTLGHIGPAAQEATDIAIEGCCNDDKGISYASMYVLGQLGPQAMRAKDALKAHLDSDARYHAATAAWALAMIDPGDPDLISKGVPLFVETLDSENPNVRREAAIALGKLGQPAKSALPALKKATGDKNPEAAKAATAAIKIIQGG